jgi:hypothetical protein
MASLSLLDEIVPLFHSIASKLEGSALAADARKDVADLEAIVAEKETAAQAAVAAAEAKAEAWLTARLHPAPPRSPRSPRRP